MHRMGHFSLVLASPRSHHILNSSHLHHGSSERCKYHSSQSNIRISAAKFNSQLLISINTWRLYKHFFPIFIQFTCHVDPQCGFEESCPAAAAASASSAAAGPVIPSGFCHRWCPLPHYAVISCMIAFMTVAIFLRYVRNSLSLIHI